MMDDEKLLEVCIYRGGGEGRGGNMMDDKKLDSVTLEVCIYRGGGGGGGGQYGGQVKSHLAELHTSV